MATAPITDLIVPAHAVTGPAEIPAGTGTQVLASPVLIAVSISCRTDRHTVPGETEPVRIGTGTVAGSAVLGIFEYPYTITVAECSTVRAGDLRTDSIRAPFIGSTGMPANPAVERVLIEIGNRPVAMRETVAINASLPGATEFPAFPAVLCVVTGPDTGTVTEFHTGFKGTCTDTVGTDLVGGTAGVTSPAVCRIVPGLDAHAVAERRIPTAGTLAV